MAGPVACGAACRGIALDVGVADWAAIPAAGRSVLVLAPCGLGLIPISSNVQIDIPVELTKEREEVDTKTYFAILGKIDLESLGVVLEPKRSHGKQDILPIDRLALLLLTFFGCCATLADVSAPRISRSRHTFAGDEGNEFAHTFLHTLFGFFGDFGIFGQGGLHDPGNWCKVSYISI